MALLTEESVQALFDWMTRPESSDDIGAARGAMELTKNRIDIVEARRILSDEFNGNSLEELAKRVSVDTHISYLPSRQTTAGGTDGNLVRLHRRDPKVFKKVVTGK